MDQKLAKSYADVLLQYGVNLQPEQLLLINAPVEAHEFVTVLVNAAYAHGAGDVQVDWQSGTVFAQRLQYAQEDSLLYTRPSQITKAQEYLAENRAIISLVSCDSPLFKEVPTTRINAFQQAKNKVFQFYSQAIMNSQVQWLVAAVATPTWAALLFPDETPVTALEKLWDSIFYVSRIQNEDALAAWQNHLDTLHRRRRLLDALRLDTLHYMSKNGTDFVIGLPDTHIWQGGNEKSGRAVPFAANIPTEEIFTAPDFRRMTGHVTSTRPLVVYNQTVEGLELDFVDGKVVQVEASKGKEAIEQLLASDEGARFLGEVALVPKDSPIAQIPYSFYETLIDENASCHLALGAAYPTCITDGKTKNDDELTAAGLNRSMIHVDFMIGSSDLTIVGRTKDGREVEIFHDGNFSPDFA
ncbi:aminopeptidase [Negativicoccus succinicivorans]|uniref:aminopeptidase n=1 Tax=Negativicoccus succinicivorans TaxID=620903 RepID=UPI0028D3A381|nr:aminopeptidase [Negativicoccus succinicivorans]